MGALILSSDGSEIFREFIDEGARRLRLPKGVPPEEYRDHLAVLMAMATFGVPDADVYRSFREAVLKGQVVDFVLKQRSTPPETDPTPAALVSSIGPRLGLMVSTLDAETDLRAPVRLADPQLFNAIMGYDSIGPVFDMRHHADFSRLETTDLARERTLAKIQHSLLQLAGPILQLSSRMAKLPIFSGANTPPGHIMVLARLWYLVELMQNDPQFFRQVDLDFEGYRLRRLFENHSSGILKVGDN